MSTKASEIVGPQHSRVADQALVGVWMPELGHAVKRKLDLVSVEHLNERRVLLPDAQRLERIQQPVWIVECIADDEHHSARPKPSCGFQDQFAELPALADSWLAKVLI